MKTFEVTWKIPSANELQALFSKSLEEQIKCLPDFIFDAICNSELVLCRSGKRGIGFVHQSVEDCMMFDARPFLKPGQYIVNNSNDDIYKDDLLIYDGDDN